MAKVEDPQKNADAGAMDRSQRYKIRGVDVEFPYKPYGPQLAFMGKVLAALEQSRVQRIGSVNALLESPTGSGKTLALLCATLAWQQQFESMPPIPAPVISDPLVGGGGFIVEDRPPDVGPEDEGQNNLNAEPQNGGKPKKQLPKKRKVPMIYYATRTHTQITQVIREFRKTKYRVPMAVLAARKHYCTNKHVLKKKNVDEDCKLLLKDEGSCCPQFKNVQKLKSHSSLQKGGANDIHDIEDLVGLGHKVRGCAYFAARALATEADIVFCPYSYIVDPVIRRAMEIDLQGAIVVLDEAHNIEDVARDAGSFDLEISLLQDIRLELEQLAMSDEGGAEIYAPLSDMVQATLAWIQYQESKLLKLDFEHYASSWRGEKAMEELRAAGITLETFQVLIECSNKAVGAASNPDETLNHLSGRAAIALEGLFSALKFMLLDGGRRAGDYQLVVKKYVKRDEGLAVAGWVTTMSLWCLNPGVVFEDIATACRSIILTSGTLSPLDSFASELGVPFDIQLEAPHVIDMDKQVWAAAVSTGPDNISLNASYKNADGYPFQDAVGIVLEEVFRVVPDGALTFFPSYKLLDKLCARWKSTGQWVRLSNQKELFVEPRGNNDQFEQLLQDFYRAVESGKVPPDGNAQGGIEKKQQHQYQKAPMRLGNRAGGAAFLAVCRGKVSEGIDFSDKNARIVVIIGIPFPNVKDIQVTLKKQYNQENRMHKKLLSGDQWYCQQTFRALNQAVGRCIRHRNDYGAILLLDDRFKKPSNIEYMSKWLRKSIRQCESYKESLEGLQTFFKGFKESTSAVEPLKVLPAATLKSNHKSKLHNTPSILKSDNQRKLKGYTTKVQPKKASHQVDAKVLKSSSIKQSSAKGQAVAKHNRKIQLKRGSKLSYTEQQAGVNVQESIKQKVALVDISNAEVHENKSLPPGIPEEPDSDYEVFSLWDDRAPWSNDHVEQAATSDVEFKSEHESIEMEEDTMDENDYLQLTQLPAKTARIRKTLHCQNIPTRLLENAQMGDSSEVKGVSLAWQNNEDLTEGCAPGNQHTDSTLVTESCPVNVMNTFGSPLKSCTNAPMETPNANFIHRTKDRNVKAARHCHFIPPHGFEIVDLTNGDDRETITCCVDTPENSRSWRICHRENQSADLDKGQEDRILDGRLSEMHSIKKASVLDTACLPEQMGPLEDYGIQCRSRNFLAWMENSSPVKDTVINQRRNFGEQDDVQLLNGELHPRRKTSLEVHGEINPPTVDTDGCMHLKPSSAPEPFCGHPVQMHNCGQSDCDSTATILTDRVTSGLHASRIESSHSTISCKRCSCLFSNPGKVIHTAFSKSYLFVLCNAIGVAYRTQLTGLSIPVLSMEFDMLHSFVKESLTTARRSITCSPLLSLDTSLPSGGVWVKEDGCVYEHIFCPSCEDQRYCIGVHIAATDKANQFLMDQVLFLEECINVTVSCPMEMQERTAQIHKADLSPLPNQAPVMQCEQSTTKRAWPTTPSKPKTPPIPGQHYAVETLSLDLPYMLIQGKASKNKSIGIVVKEQFSFHHELGSILHAHPY